MPDKIIAQFHALSFLLQQQKQKTAAKPDVIMQI